MPLKGLRFRNIKEVFWSPCVLLIFLVIKRSDWDFWEEVHGRRTRVLTSREATSPIGDLETIVNLPILVSSYCCHFLSSPFVSSPTPRSSESFLSFAPQDSSESCFVVVFCYSSRSAKSSEPYFGCHISNFTILCRFWIPRTHRCLGAEGV